MNRQQSVLANALFAFMKLYNEVLSQAHWYNYVGNQVSVFTGKSQYTVASIKSSVLGEPVDCGQHQEALSFSMYFSQLGVNAGNVVQLQV